jgi:hypothetical protein
MWEITLIKYKMKYIVYLTINSKNNKIYIGVHGTEDPKIFDGYIGCGVNIFNSGTYKKSKTAFQYAVNKYGVDSFKRVTLKVFESESEAYKLESELVNAEFIKRNDVYNMALGGHKGPDQSVKIYQYSLEGEFLKEWSSFKEVGSFYHCSPVSIENATKTLHQSKGFYWTIEFFNKLDLTQFSNKPVRDFIYEYDLDGNFIKQYKTTKDIAREYNITVCSVNAAIRGNWKCCGHYFSVEKTDKFIPVPKQKYRNNAVYLYDLDGNFIREFQNATECHNYFGEKSGSKLATAIRLNRVYHNFQVSIEKVDFMKQYTYGNNKIKINQFDLNGNLIKTFDSLAQAKKEFGIGVERNIKGRCEQCKGYIFRKVNDIV